MVVYRAINKKNGKVYVGCTKYTLSERKHRHGVDSKNPNKVDRQPFLRAVAKYGVNGFEWQELCSALTINDLPELEKQLIAEYGTYESKAGYNATIGGEGVLNPRKMEKYFVRFPDGHVHLVTGYKKFCRDHDLNEGNLWHTYRPTKRTYPYKKVNGETKYYTYWQQLQTTKGYTLLGKFNDYPEGEYPTDYVGEAVDSE